MNPINFQSISQRVNRLVPILEKRKVQALLVMVTEGYNWESAYYMSGFRGTSCSLLISGERNVLITDGRYLTQAADQTPFTVVDQAGESMAGAVIREIRRLGLTDIGFEADKMTMAQYALLNNSETEWIDLKGAVQSLRRTKDEEELSLIGKAAKIAMEAYEETLAQTHIGMTERDFANRLEYSMKNLGAEGGWPGHEFIVASGVRSAMPHGVPTDKCFAAGDWVTVDFGATYEGYVSDITRNFVIGTPSSEAVKIHKILYEAHMKSADALCPGVVGRKVDAIARNIIKTGGYGKCFSHGLGHSIGLEIHEEPRLSLSSVDILKPGDVVTIEPGIYVEGMGGMRIEDDYLVTEENGKCLSSGPDEGIRVIKG